MTGRSMTAPEASGGDKLKVLLVVYSYHHGNTGKVADAIAGELGAEVLAPDQVTPDVLAGYDLVGFGAGIDSGKHYRPLLELADRLPKGLERSAFIFSTCGLPAAFAQGELFERQIEANHSELRAKLQERGYRILDEWSCVGFNTNSFLKFFGGLNKGRPDANDLAEAKAFARKLLGSFAATS
jgi:flavodoxin